MKQINITSANMGILLSKLIDARFQKNQRDLRMGNIKFLTNEKEILLDLKRQLYALGFDRRKEKI